MVREIRLTVPGARLGAIVGVALLAAAPYLAHAEAAPAAADPEAQMDAQLQRMGYVGGRASNCQATSEAKVKHGKTALNIATGILRLFGSDRAFTFAAAYGAGAAENLDAAQCADALKQYDAMIAKIKTLTQAQ
jgi:hypothetical protein